MLGGMQRGDHRGSFAVRGKLAQPTIDFGSDVIRQLHSHFATTVITP
jgi:hypothetical protein